MEAPIAAQPEAISMRLAWSLGVLAAVTSGACSHVPFIGSGDGPHLTNAAVEACKRKADDLGYDGIGERQSMPGADGRYTIILDVREQQGFAQITCAYDPAKGAQIDKEKPASS
jgi:hypothetical protein